MIKTKHIFLILIPAILVVIFALFIRFLQYIPTDSIGEKDEQKQEQLNQIPIYPDDPIIGNKKAPISLIIFDDLGCSACQKQNIILEQLLEKYPDKIKIIWKSLPITQIPFPSKQAHEYAFCANKQNKFDEFKKIAFVNKDNLSSKTLQVIAEKIELDTKKLNSCLNSGQADTYITTTEELARVFNIQAIPTVFLNNIQIKYPETLAGWEELLGLTD